MSHGVITNFVPLRNHSAKNSGVFPRVFTGNEKSRLHIAGTQNIQHPRRILRVWTVIVGQSKHRRTRSDAAVGILPTQRTGRRWPRSALRLRSVRFFADRSVFILPAVAFFGGLTAGQSEHPEQKKDSAAQQAMWLQQL